MNKTVLLLAIVILIPVGLESAFAQTTHIINIPTGAASPDAPYFWQVESTGNTQGIITIRVNDFVSWENADTAFHTVTSGTAEEGPDEIFDSGLFGPGKSFTHQFTEIGEYPYYCTIHPWMIGEVRVVDADDSKILHNVGSGLDQKGTGFDVSYILDRHLEEQVEIDTTRKTLTFTVAGQTENDELVLRLPHELIQEPVAVWVDDIQITNFLKEGHEDFTLVTIPLQHNSEEIVIMGTNVIPEFGTIVYIILAASIIGVIVLTNKFKMIEMPKL
jgi:predicted secreted protein with PEFG-CTERM motif